MEEYQGECLPTLQTLPSVLFAQIRECEVRKKALHPSMSPVDFICMDLIGEFHPPTRHDHHFALTACCMLTGFT